MYVCHEEGIMASILTGRKSTLRLRLPYGSLSRQGDSPKYYNPDYGSPFHISQFGAVFFGLACPATSDCSSGMGPGWESGL